MRPIPEELAADLFDLHARLAMDRARGGLRSVREYQELFPGLEDEVRAAHASATSNRESEPTEPQVVEPERRVGRYRLLREVGRGGQGTVHLAEDTHLGRRVALKMLTGVAQFSSDARKRFQREAETASRLDHPSICTIYESGFDGDLAYIAMRFVEGETLSRRLARVRSMRDTGARGGERAPCAPGDRAELATTLRFFEEASRALHAAHEAGVIHRDVKPGNLVVSTDVKPVVLDFGLARALESTGEQITQTGDQVGTPSYMSPEQIDAQGRPLDRRTDVYSLGATLYECLVLEAPFQKPTLASLYHAILREPPRDPRSLTRSIPRELVIVLQTALEKDRDRRYTTALDFAEDLRRVRELEPIRARRAGLGLRTLRWVQRHPARAIALGAILVILALGVVTRVIATDLAMKRVLERDRAVESRLLDLLADTPMRGTRHDWRAELEEYERALADYGIDLGTEGDHEANAQTVRAAGVRDPGLREKLLGALRHVVELVARARLADPALARGIQDDLAPESAGDSRCTQLEVAANDLVETLEEDPWRRALWSAFRARARGAADELDPFITAALGPERSAADSLLVADLAYSFREREVVRRLYDVAERKPSDDPNVRYAVRVSRGLLRHRLGDLGGAWTDLRAACDVRPRVGAVHQALARIAQAREDPSAAEEHAERAVQLDAGDGHAWLLLANARARQSELEGAEAAAHRALALEPDFANARELLGNIAWSRGEELDAFQEWDLAAAASGDASALWARVGSTALSRLALEELSDVFASVGAGPEISKPIWIARARQSLAAGRASAAVDALRIARRDAPDDPQVTLELGRAECAAGDRVAGLALLGEAAAARSEDAQVHIALAEALLAHGDPHRARPTLERVLELQPAHVEARIALAGLELRPGGDPLRAREILDGIASDRRTGEWHAMRSQAWIALGDFVESSGELFRGLERFPRDPVLHALARANHSDPRQRVDLDARYVALERAHPQVAELLVLRAHLARRAGDRASARSHLDRARGVDPRCIEALIETSALEFEARRFGDAVTAVREGLVLDAGVVAKAEELAAALDGVGAVDELFDLTLFTLDRAPDSRVGLALHARAALALGQERHLATRARRVRERDPERSDALCIEARALDALGDEESARRLLTTAAAARLEDAQVRSTFEALWGPGAGHVSGEPEAILSQGTPLSAEELLLRRDYQRAAEAYLAMRADERAPALGFDAARAAARAAELAARNGAEASSRGVGSSAPAFDPAELAELALDILEREHLQRAALAAGPLDRDTLQRLRAHSRRVLDTRDLAFLRRAPREARWAERARDHFLRVRSFVRELSTRDT